MRLCILDTFSCLLVSLSCCKPSFSSPMRWGSSDSQSRRNSITHPCTRPIWKKIRAIPIAPREHEFNSEERGIMRVIVRRRRPYGGCLRGTRYIRARRWLNTRIILGSCRDPGCRMIRTNVPRNFASFEKFLCDHSAIILIFDLNIFYLKSTSSSTTILKSLYVARRRTRRPLDCH
jgi:hypothetical protein